MKILVLGGYGAFGGRLVELLSDLAQLDFVVAGRSLDKAKAFCRACKGRAGIVPRMLDRKDIAAGLSAIKPDIVVDASGPFQDYGDDPYIVVRACIAAKVHYLDLADGADFVLGISQFNKDAKKAGIFVLSGVSSFPVLTAAVLRDMAAFMDVETVTGGIAPSPYAGIGLSVMKAVISYAGDDVNLMRNGMPATAIGLAESRYFTIAPPGHLPLPHRRFSLVDVPDLRLIPALHPGIQEIWIGAGPVPETLHVALNVLTKLRASLRLPSLSPLAPIFHRVLQAMRFGEHRGGMFIHVNGTRDSEPTERSWHLLAEGDDGPYIPSMAVEALVRKHLKGHMPTVGARPATGELRLDDYEKLFAKKTIYTGFRSSPKSAATAFETVLDADFVNLPAPLRAFHSAMVEQVWHGEADIRRGRNPLAKLIGKIVGFPDVGSAVPVSVTARPNQGGERWIRQFGSETFSSHLQPGSGRNQHLMLERFGPISVAMALVRKENRLYFIPRRWSIFGMPLPRFAMPYGESFETEREGRFCFDVEIRIPVIGLIAGYRGWLEPVSNAGTPDRAISSM